MKKTIAVNKDEVHIKTEKTEITSNGGTTCVMVDGKVYGDHVVKVEFVHDNKDKLSDVRLLVTTDCVPLEGNASDEERQGFMKRIEELSKEQKGDEKSGRSR